jgi:hypothetical protein
MLSGAAVCGFADFQCNPLDAADEIVVIPGVAVTSVQRSRLDQRHLSYGGNSFGVRVRKEIGISVLQ